MTVTRSAEFKGFTLDCGECEVSKNLLKKLVRTGFGILPASIKDPLLRKAVQIPMSVPDELTIKVAESESELKAAFKVLYNAYEQKGYTKKQVKKYRITKYHMLPTTTVLIAKWNEEVIGTFSVIQDSFLGLPADGFSDLSELRNKSHSVGELSCLAVKKEFRQKNNLVFLLLVKAMLNYAIKYLQLDFFIISVHPSSKAFYRAVMGMIESRGRMTRHYGFANNQPAIVFFQNVETWYRLLEKRFDSKTEDQNLYQFMISPCENIQLPRRDYYKSHDMVFSYPIFKRLFCDLSKALEELDSDQKQYLGDLFVSTKIRRILKQKLHSYSKRLVQRYPLHCRVLLFQYPRRNQPLRIEQGWIQDVSAQGMRIFSQQSLAEQGQSLKLVIQMGPTKRLCLEGRIVWCSPNGQCGIELQRSHVLWESFVNYQRWNGQENGKKTSMITTK